MRRWNWINASYLLLCDMAEVRVIWIRQPT
jgi:hypothetical protein